MIYIVSHKSSLTNNALGNLFCRSLIDNGYNTQHVKVEKIDDHQYKSGDICIVVGAGRFKLFDKSHKEDGAAYVLFQTEILPTSDDEMRESNDAKIRLGQLENILPHYDYYFEPQNSHIPFMKSRGWEVHGCVPLGYHDSIDYTTKFPNLNMEWDAMFAGGKSKRRNLLLRDIDECCKLYNSHNIRGDNYYKVILQSRIGLNLHYTNVNTFESWRIMNYLSNKKLVISEPILDPSPLIGGKHFIVASRENFCNVIRDCIANFDRYKYVAEEAYTFIKQNLKFNDATKKMLEIVEGEQNRGA